MKTTLRIDLTVENIYEGFEYNELEGKGLFGWNGKLTIQPEYQRNYLYARAKMEEVVIDSILNGYPIGLLYFNKPNLDEEKFEVLDGQQRITSLGRFLSGLFAVKTKSGHSHYFDSLSADEKKKILETKLTIYICEGTEAEIKSWFKTINIAGIPLNRQEVLNSVYSGSFVTLAKAEFSNSKNSELDKWKTYVKGNEYRQEILQTALEWVAKSSDDKIVEKYMSEHRHDKNISELKNYFETVIAWIEKIFPTSYAEMCGLDWGKLIEIYHEKIFDAEKISSEVEKLYLDEYVTNKRGIFEYVLSDEKNPKLLQIRLFEKLEKQKSYDKQTKLAKEKNISNCSACVLEGGKNKNKIWKASEMEADHVTAWSKGGATDLKNCQMLCKFHNRLKGNN